MVKHVPVFTLYWLLLAGQCSGQKEGLTNETADFAIETEIIHAENKGPVTRNTTFFVKGDIYDVQQDGNRLITVFNGSTKRQKFTLLDPKQRIQAVLWADELVRFIALKKTKAEESESLAIRFAANPEFDESYDAAHRYLILNSPFWRYEVRGLPVESRIARQYRSFSDWYANLNVIYQPPWIRLELNRVIEQRQLVPLSVRVQILRDGEIVFEQHSKHSIRTSLASGDRERIERIRQQMKDFEFVTVDKLYSVRLAKVKPGRS